MRATFRRLLIFPLLLPLAAMAAPALDGHWDVTFSTRDGESRQAVVEISGGAGTWTSLPRSGKEKRDPCVDRPFPLKVASASPTQVVLEVAFAATIPGCKDRVGKGKIIDDNVIEGKLENGKPLRMVRRAGK